MAFMAGSSATLSSRLPMPAALRAPVCRGPAATRRAFRLQIDANTIWQLTPDTKWSAQNPQYAKNLKPVDLTGEIGKKNICTVGDTKDHGPDSDEVFGSIGGGVHVEFESKGGSNPLDSPSVLTIKDIDSSVEVTVDGKKLDKNAETPLHPGAVITFGDHAVYQVERNLFAHA